MQTNTTPSGMEKSRIDISRRSMMSGTAAIGAICLAAPAMAGGDNFDRLQELIALWAKACRRRNELLDMIAEIEDRPDRPAAVKITLGEVVDQGDVRRAYSRDDLGREFGNEPSIKYFFGRKVSLVSGAKLKDIIFDDCREALNLLRDRNASAKRFESETGLAGLERLEDDAFREMSDCEERIFNMDCFSLRDARMKLAFFDQLDREALNVEDYQAVLSSLRPFFDLPVEPVGSPS